MDEDERELKRKEYFRKIRTDDLRELRLQWDHLPDDLDDLLTETSYLLEDVWLFTDYFERYDTPTQNDFDYPSLHEFYFDQTLHTSKIIDFLKPLLDATSDSVVSISGIYAPNVPEAVVRIAIRLVQTVFFISIQDEPKYRPYADEVFEPGMWGVGIPKETWDEAFSKEKINENWTDIRAAIAALPPVDVQEVFSLVERNIAQAWRWRKEQGISIPEPAPPTDVSQVVSSAQMDFVEGAFVLNGKQYDLSGKPLEMLRAVAESHGGRCRADSMLVTVWSESLVDGSTIRSTAARVRKMLRRALADQGQDVGNPFPRIGRGRDLAYKLDLP